MCKPNELSTCLDINGLHNLVKDGTYFKGTPSIIDLVIMNNAKRFKRIQRMDTGLSDFHSLICAATKLHMPELKPSTIKYRSFKNFNSDLLVGTSQP